MAEETKASRAMLYLTLLTTILAMLLFAWYTYLTTPQTFVILVATIILAWVVEAIWLRTSQRQAEAVDRETRQP
jgi:Na+-driven multidrug efflux pump